MSRCFRWVSVVILFALVAPVGADEKPKPKPVKLEKTWGGEVKIELRKEAPKDGYVADKEAWAKLWKTFRGDEKLPDVDFTKELVLVAVNNDPNKIGINAQLDDKGDLNVSVISTLIGFVNPTTCTYQFATVKREGIKTIGGKAIAK
jgi:hypothetical protein